MQNLILIHGAIGSGSQLLPLQKALSAHINCSILEFDGHGSKSHLDNPFTLAHLKKQLATMLNQQEGKTHIFGYSLGGFIALLEAADVHPNISSIFTLGTKMRWNPEITAKESTMLNPDKIEVKVPAFAHALAQRHGADRWKKVLNNTADLLQKIGRVQPLNQKTIANIKCPLHLCLADQDAMVTEEETREVQEWAKDASFSQLPNSKHPIEQVEIQELANRISSFVKLV